MKFAFVTCVKLGLSCMEAIYDVGGRLDLVITLPDDRAINKAGRIFLDEFCSSRNISLIKSKNVNDDVVVNAIIENQIDWLFIIGWSQIALERVLSAPLRGVLGMHPTLLPQGRGRAGIPWAILKNLDVTGVTLFKLDGGIDTGDIIDQQTIPLRSDITAFELYNAANAAHVDLIRSVFPKLERGTFQLRPQNDELASEWPGRTPEDGRIDTKGSVYDAEKLVRAVTRPYPGAFIETENGKLIIWEALVVNLENLTHSTDTYIRFYDGYLQCLVTQLET